MLIEVITSHNFFTIDTEELISFYVLKVRNKLILRFKNQKILAIQETPNKYYEKILKKANVEQTNDK